MTSDRPSTCSRARRSLAAFVWATAANQVWSWDITKLLGPAKWTYFYLYVILDIFSRYVVGWMVAPQESAELAKRLIGESCRKQRIEPGQLTLHADRGSSMKSKPVAFLLEFLETALHFLSQLGILLHQLVPLMPGLEVSPHGGR